MCPFFTHTDSPLKCYAEHAICGSKNKINIMIQLVASSYQQDGDHLSFVNFFSSQMQFLRGGVWLKNLHTVFGSNTYILGIVVNTLLVFLFLFSSRLLGYVQYDKKGRAGRQVGAFTVQISKYETRSQATTHTYIHTHIAYRLIGHSIITYFKNIVMKMVAFFSIALPIATRPH